MNDKVYVQKGIPFGHQMSKFGFLPIIIVIGLIGFGALEPRFLSIENLINILQQSSFLLILSLAQMFALIVRGLDLSIGQLISAISVAMAIVMTAGLGDGWLAVASGVTFALAFGLAVGLVNGFVINALNVNPLIATLGMMGVCQGLATTISGGFPVFNLPPLFSAVFGGTIIGLPVPIVAALLISIAVHLLLTRTVIGRSMYIVGDNSRAAYVAGISVGRIRSFAFTMTSVLAAIGAILFTARTGSGEPMMGSGSIMLQTFAAAIIGGVSLRGGGGGLYNCVTGSLFITILSIGMNLVRIDGQIQLIVLGLVLVLSVGIEQLRQRS